MNPDYSKQFFVTNIQSKMPDGHVCFFMQRAIGTNEDGKVGGCWHSTTNLQGVKHLLEQH